MTQDISVETLVAAGLTPTAARTFEDALKFACDRFDINTPARIGGFIGQARIESAEFTDLEECLFYTTPEVIRATFSQQVSSLSQASILARNPRALATVVYSNRLGNGGPASGDGWAFRGRGLFQITGRDRYHDAAVALAYPYDTQPDLVATPAHAALTAAWYWHTIKGNELADSAQWSAITRAVNGPAMKQADLRQQYSERAMQAFN